MIPISVSDELHEICPNIHLGCIETEVVLQKDHEKLWEQIQSACEEIEQNLKSEEISKLYHIANSRKAYKALGKDPARYRLSAEAMLRRVVKGKGLYKINNVVDLLNLVSITTGYSIGGYDADKIQEQLTFGIGRENEPYEGIGRGTLNIHCLPTFRDALGACGTPTSDSVRTSVQDSMKRFLMIIVDFNGQEGLEKTMKIAMELLQNMASAQNMESKIVRYEEAQ